MKFLQFHLSTAIALMVTAGLLLAANYFWTPGGGTDTYGWPCQAFYISDMANLNGTGFAPTGVFKAYWDVPWAIFDAAVALLTLIWVGFIFEARHWIWPGGKIFVWAFVGAALILQMLAALQYLIKGPG